MDGYGVPLAKLLHIVWGCVSHTIWEPDMKHREVSTAALSGPRWPHRRGAVARPVGAQPVGPPQLPIPWARCTTPSGMTHSLEAGCWEVSGQVGQSLSGFQLVPSSPFTSTCFPGLVPGLQRQQPSVGSEFTPCEGNYGRHYADGAMLVPTLGPTCTPEQFSHLESLNSCLQG